MVMIFLCRGITMFELNSNTKISSRIFATATRSYNYEKCLNKYNIVEYK